MSRFFLILFAFISISSFAQDIDQMIRESKKSDIMKQKISKLSYESRDKYGRNALMIAILIKEKNITQFLLERGIGLNVKDYLGRTPLMYAAMRTNSEELVLKLLNAGASVNVEDKMGRGPLFYAKKSQSLKMLEIIQNEIKKAPAITEGDISNLKDIVNKGEASSLVDFYSKFRTLDVKIEKLNFVEYLIQNKLLNRFGIATYIEMGCDLNKTYALHSALETKEFTLAERLVDSFVSLGPRDKDDKSALAIALEHGVDQNLLDKILKQMVSFNYIDNDGNNLLHYAVKAKNSSIVSNLIKKGVSPTQLNKKGESPASLAISNHGDEILVESVLVGDVDYSSQVDRSNDIAMELARNYPKIYVKKIKEITDSGYDLNQKNESGQTSTSILRENNPTYSQSVDINSINVDSIPDFSKLLEVDFDSSRTEYSDLDIPKFDERERPYTGDSLLDDLFYNSVVDYITDLKGRYFEELLRSGINDSGSEFEKEIIKKNKALDRVLKSIVALRQESDALVDFYNLTKKEVEREQKQFSIQKEAYDQSFAAVKIAVGQLVSKALLIESDLMEYKSLNEELELIVRRLKNGEHEDVVVLNEAKRNLKVLETGYKSVRSQVELDYNNQVNENAVYVSNLESELAEHRAEVSRANSQISELERNIEKLNNQITGQRNYINSPAHRNIHVEDRNRCPHVDKIHELSNEIESDNKRIERLQDDIKEFKNRANNISKQLEVSRKEFALKKSQILREKREHLAQLDANYNQEVENFKVLIESSEISVRAAYEDVKFKIELLNSEISTKYGPLYFIDGQWSELRSLVSSLNAGINSYDGLFRCGASFELYSCGLKEEYKNIGGFIGQSVMSELQEIEGRYSDFYRANNKLSFGASSLDKLDSFRDRIDEVDSEITAQMEEEFHLRRDIEDLKTESSQTEGLLKDLVNKVFELYLNSIFPMSSDESYSQKLGAEIKSLSNKLSVPNELSFATFVQRKIMPASTTMVSFNDLDFDGVKSIRKLHDSDEVAAIKQWHKLLRANNILSGRLAKKINSDLFANAIARSAEVSIVAANKVESVQISTTYGNFLLNSRGEVIDVKAKSIFDLDLISTGEYRQRIENILNLTKSDLLEKFSMVDIQKSFHVNLVLKMLSVADRLYWTDVGAEVLSYVEIIAKTGMVFSGVGVSYKALTALPGCGLEIYRKVSLDVKLSKVEMFQLVANCISTFYFGDTLLKYSQPLTYNLVKSLKASFSKTSNPMLKKTIIEIVEGFVGLIEKNSYSWVSNIDLSGIELKNSDFYNNVAQIDEDATRDIQISINGISLNLKGQSFYLKDEIELFEFDINGLKIYSYLDESIDNLKNSFKSIFGININPEIKVELSIKRLQKGQKITLLNDRLDLLVLDI